MSNPRRRPPVFPETPGLAARAAARAYGFLVRAHAAAWDAGVLRPVRVPVPVVSIGNITVGGTGKTPAIKRLAAELAARGRRPVVLTRGWGRSGGAPLVLDGSAALPAVGEAGDEPLELAAALPGVPIVVDANRRRAARRAVEALGAGCLLLDDGFQHRALARDLDIVLVDARRPFGNGRLLPAGPLREAPSALARADLILLTRAARVAPAALDATRALLERRAPTALFGTARHDVVGWREATGPAAPLDRLVGADVLAVSGLADNAQFVDAVADTGARPSEPLGFPDHHAYTPRDLAEVRQAAAGRPIVTTEKDLVRWRDVPGFGAGEGWWALVIRFEPATGAAFYDGIEARLFAGRAAKSEPPVAP